MDKVTHRDSNVDTWCWLPREGVTTRNVGKCFTGDGEGVDDVN